MPKRKILSFILILLLHVVVKAQSLPADSALESVLKGDRLLLMLIDSAVANSPEIKRNAKGVELYEQNLQVSRRSLLNSLFLTSNYGYGNVGNLTMEKDQSGVNPLAYYSNLRSSRYNIGVAVQLPLGSLLSRKHTNRSAEIQIQMAEEEKANTSLFVKQETIKLYQQLKLAHALLLTSAKMKQTMFMSVSMAEKNFMSNQLPLEQFSKLQNDYHQTVLDYDTQLNKFQTSFLILEAYTGVKLARLINQVK